MYYRGANAALLLYDITNISTFDDIRGWLEELKRNCPPDLIIYIVGSKADLHRHRQVTSDLARLSLHTWFPPPRLPTPPPPPQPSTLSYIRPRFTSFTSNRSVPATTPPLTNSSESPPCAEPPTSHSSALKRAGAPHSRPTAGANLARSKTTTAASGRILQPSRHGHHFGSQGAGWNEIEETSSNSLPGDEEDQEWGLHKDMELFEVSAKDDLGIQGLFDSLISAIILRKDTIEQENELKKRDSVFLSSVNSPAWTAQAEEEEAREKAAASSAGGWSCCS